ncbi:MAG TPA: alpha/beta hydrolase [Candidatus Saccharimonadales bacterium]|nr:alpha/beta hydrolase [Candidatus Saccharimonadales bacterium]
MTIPEQSPHVLFEQPKGEAHAQAIYVPGFGDTPDGPFGALLRRRLLTNGIAVATVLSSEPLGANSGVGTIPLSSQTERFLDVVEQTDPRLPVHGIGMSQGGFVASEALLLFQDEGREPNGSWFAVNTPATGPYQRLKPQLLPSMAPSTAGTVLDPQNRRIAVSHRYWQEVEGLDPLAQLKEAYQSPAFNVVLASQDQVLKEEVHEMAETFRGVDPKRLHVIQGADHYLSNHKGRHRRYAVGLIVGNILAATNRQLHAAGDGGNVVLT